MNEQPRPRFRIRSLPREPFAALIGTPDAELRPLGVRRLPVDASPGFPCRVSLRDAEPGESVLALNWQHHHVDGPYRASGPIFVRDAAVGTDPEPGEVPTFLRHRQLSLRGYDGEGMMRLAVVTGGERLGEEIEAALVREEIAYLHVHNAGPGCYMCAVERFAG